MLTELKQRLRHHRKDLAAAAAIVVFTAIFFAPLFRGRTFSMVGAHMFAQYPWAATVNDDAGEIVGRGYPQTDHAETFYPASVFATKAIRSGQFPMWLPYSFSGIPIMEVGLGTGLLYPPKLLLMLKLSPIRQHDALLIMHLLLAGLGMYALLRWWGAAAMGAVFGAIAWELNGYQAFWLTFEHAAIAAAWFPLMMLWSDLAIKRRSVLWAIACGSAVGMSMLSFINHVYVGVIVLACWYSVIAAISAWRLFKKGNRRSAWFCLSLPLISAGVAAALSAASWLAILDLMSDASRQPQTLEVQLAEAIPLADALRALVWHVSANEVAGNTFAMAGVAFTGIPAILLAVFALVSLPDKLRRRSSPMMVAALAFAVSAGIALAWQPLIILLRSALPFFGAIHPYTALYICCFSIAVLGACGMSEAHRWLRRLKLHRSFLFGLGCVLVATEAWQLIGFAWLINPVQPARRNWLFPETAFTQALQSLQGEFHVLPVGWRLETGAWTPPVLPGKTAACFEVQSSSGYESLLPQSTATFWRAVEQGGRLAADVPPAFRPTFFHDRLPLGLIEKASVGLLATPPGVKPLDIMGAGPTSDGRAILVYQGADGWIYKVTRALPRAFVVPRVTAVADPTAAMAMLADDDFDVSKSAVVIGEQAAAGTGLVVDAEDIGFEGTASITSHRVNEVIIEAVTSRAAMLVLNDSWDHGWKAYIDGTEQPVLRVNYTFRGVVLPLGHHQVVFAYRPRLLLTGLAISATTLLLLLALTAIVSARGIRQLRSRVAKTLSEP